MLYGIHVVFLRSYAAFSPSRELSCTSVTKEAFQGCREFLCELSRTSLTKEAFQGCREFLCISVPSAVMICLQWWSFELLILLSGLLPKAQLETSGFDKNRKKILLADLNYL